jgi:hypothetical protein
VDGCGDRVKGFAALPGYEPALAARDGLQRALHRALRHQRRAQALPVQVAPELVVHRRDAEGRHGAQNTEFEGLVHQLLLLLALALATASSSPINTGNT